MEERSSPPQLTADGLSVSKARKLSPMTSSLRALSLQPSRSPETYVVQIPRDQVYRVPPPENARIVESHRKPEVKKKRKCTCCCWVLAVLLVLGVIVGTVVLVVRAMYAPLSPTFSITNINFKNVTVQNNNAHVQKNKPAHTQTRPLFTIDLKMVNPNERMDVAFGKNNNGKASLIFKKQEIGQGKPPSISQNPEDSTNIHLNLDGTSKLSGDIQRSFGDDKTLIMMSLTIDAPMEVTSWAKNKKKDVTVTCDFDVISLTKKPTIKSQTCWTDF